MDEMKNPSDPADQLDLNPTAIELQDDLEGDTLREECGVFGIFGHPEAAAITALGLHALQHRGQEAAGIVSFDGSRFHSEKRLGLVGDTFSRREVIERLPGNLAALPADWVHETFGLGGPPSVWDRGSMIQSLAELGRFDEAAKYEAEMMRLAEPTEHAFTISMALFAASVLHVHKGDWAEALSRIERWVAIARTGNVSFHLSWGIACSAWPMAQLGEASEALNRLREGEPLLERLAARQILASLAWFYCSLARACLLLGQRDEARRLGDRALEFCSSQPGFEAHVLHLLGDVAAHPDQFDAERGETHYRQALALAEGLRMRPLVAHCHLGLGKVYLRTGASEQAQEHVATATTMYRNMGMTHWLEQAEAQMRQVQ